MAFQNQTSILSRLGWKKPVTVASNPTNEVDASALIGSFQLDCTLLPLDAAQRRRGRQISQPIQLGEGSWRACGGYTVGCTLLPLDVARENKEIAHRMFS